MPQRRSLLLSSAHLSTSPRPMCPENKLLSHSWLETEKLVKRPNFTNILRVLTPVLGERRWRQEEYRFSTTEPEIFSEADSSHFPAVGRDSPTDSGHSTCGKDWASFSLLWSLSLLSWLQTQWLGARFGTAQLWEPTFPSPLFSEISRL